MFLTRGDKEKNELPNDTNPAHRAVQQTRVSIAADAPLGNGRLDASCAMGLITMVVKSRASIRVLFKKEGCVCVCGEGGGELQD